MTRCAVVVGLCGGLCAGLWPAAAAAQVPVPENYGQAMDWYGRAAEAGNGRAQFYLGVMMETGVRGAPDVSAAAGWYAKAAEGGSAEAQYNLALMAERGVGMARDAARAARLFEKAADGGLARAALGLSALYAKGEGVERDSVRALMWLEVSLAGGLGGFDGFRESLAAGMRAADIEKAKAMARRHLGGTAGGG